MVLALTLTHAHTTSVRDPSGLEHLGIRAFYLILMSTYRVFLGAPSAAEIRNDPSSYSWRTFTSAPYAASHGTLSRKATLFQEDAMGNQVLDVDRTDNQRTDPELGDDVPPPLRQKSLPVIFPSPVIEAASERISMMYKDITFGEGGEDEEQLNESLLEIEGVSGEVIQSLSKEGGRDTPLQDAVSLNLSTENSKGEDSHEEVEISVFRGVGMFRTTPDSVFG